MDVLIKHLESICKQHELTEKILIVDSYMIGEQIIRQFTRKNNHIVNLKMKTIKDLACDVSSIQQSQLINDAVGSHLLYSLLTKLKPTFRYFGEVEITSTLSRAMYQTIKSLRLAGYTSDSLSIEWFISPAKGEDMYRILESYEQLLQTYKMADVAELYRNAFGKYHSRNQVFILQSDLRTTFLQEEFLKSVRPEIYYHLPIEAVRGIQTPEISVFSKVKFGDDTPLSYLYDLENSPTTVQNLSLFSAQTEEEELKEVLYKIKEKEIKFDEAAIFYTSSPRYVTAMFHLAERLGLPVTFGEGIPIGLTRPGKLVAGILNWMKEFYSVPAFIHLLQENLIDFGEEAPTKAKWASVLRGANIGWGQDRYLTQMKHKMDSFIESDDRFRDYQWIYNWFTKVIKHMPNVQSDGTILYRDLFHAVSYILEKYASVSSGYDLAAKETLLERMNNLLPYANDGMSEIYQKFKEDFLSLQVGKSRPKPGFIHMTSYRNGIYMNRENVFIVGMDNQRFPGKSGEDPLLLDIEREKIGRLLPLEKEKVKRNLYLMLQVFASSANKEITASFCRFNLNENRTVSPSYLFLQCYRIQTGDYLADFKTLQKNVRVVDPNHLLDREDWWTRKIKNSQNQKLNDSFLERFSTITRGLHAEQMRQDPAFTVYEGNIESDTTHLDPRKNQEITISAGKLEKLAKCPYAYFIEHVLRIKVIEDDSYDPTKWLDAKTRGTLLHEIFETFYRDLKSRKERPSFDKHRRLLMQVATEKLSKVKKLIPPPNARTERLESEEIMASCETFLRIEEESSESGEPLYFEYSFGEDSPAVIELPSGTVHVRGIIDRVDQLPDGTYHIIDYKTGSSWGYKTNEFFKGGRQLQHLLYTLAAEAHLGMDAGTVKKSSYFFPTRKGAGKRFVREQKETTRTNGKDILDKLLSVVEHGHFTMTDDEMDCTFCEFKSICRRSTYEKNTLKQKQQDGAAKGLKSFLGVRAYE